MAPDRVLARKHQFAPFTYKTDVHLFMGARHRNLFTIQFGSVDNNGRIYGWIRTVADRFDDRL